MIILIIALTPKMVGAVQPPAPLHNTGCTLDFIVCWEKGHAGEGGGRTGVGGGRGLIRLGDGSMRAIFYFSVRCKNRDAAQPQHPRNNTGPTRAFVGRWGKGGGGGGGVLSGLKGGGGGDVVRAG